MQCNWKRCHKLQLPNWCTVLVLDPVGNPRAATGREGGRWNVRARYRPVGSSLPRFHLRASYIPGIFPGTRIRLRVESQSLSSKPATQG
jgi:hypothetical protein